MQKGWSRCANLMRRCRYVLSYGFIMVESYIEDGNQKISEGTYGKSITDACLGWEKSEKLVLELADLL